MSLKAGRVGVAPDQVDEFGKIKSDAISGYTKQEADAKFETKTDAAAALAEKQPITLAVPIEMLSGTKLTVESALQGLNDDKLDNENLTYEEVQSKGIIVRFQKKNGVLFITITGEATEAIVNNEKICNIPSGYKPVNLHWFGSITARNNVNNSLMTIDFNTDEIVANTPIATGDKPRGSFTVIM